jgi:hypothetical protein
MTEVVADPDANVRACAPPDSIEASVDSSASLFGLAERVYSNPWRKKRQYWLIRRLQVTYFVNTDGVLLVCRAQRYRRYNCAGGCVRL